MAARGAGYYLPPFMRRKTTIPLIFALLLYLTVEAVSLAGLWALERTRGIVWSPMASRLEPSAIAGLDRFLAEPDSAKLIPDPDLGWLRRISDINAAGMRDDLEYPLEPTPGILRISAFGDSFTYGSDVPLGENWTKRISAMQPSIEILNYGLGAYGLDQAYLRYLREGTKYRPHVVFIGYMTENFARTVNVYRGFYTTSYRDFFFTKPRFKLVGDSLVLIPNPLKTMDDYRRLRDNQEEVLGELGRNDYFFAGQYGAGPFDFSPTVRLGKIAVALIRKRSVIPILTRDERYEPRSEAYLLTVAIFDQFYRKVLEDGALPVIVVLPDINDQRRSRDGLPRRYDVLLENFRAKGYRYIDALEAFEPVESQYAVDDLVVQWGHFSKLGNDLVAKHVLGKLVDWDLDEIAKVDSAKAVERQRVTPAR
jgi:hypothetical protein